jgi:hypothetical protein
LIRKQYPEVHESEKRLLKKMRQIVGIHVPAHFSALLSGGHDFIQNLARLGRCFLRERRQRLAAQQTQNHTARNYGALRRLFIQLQEKPPENLLNTSIALFHFSPRAADNVQPKLDPLRQQILFCREIIKKGPLAYIGGPGDVFNGGGAESLDGEDL